MDDDDNTRASTWRCQQLTAHLRVHMQRSAPKMRPQLLHNVNSSSPRCPRLAPQSRCHSPHRRPLRHQVTQLKFIMLLTTCSTMVVLLLRTSTLGVDALVPSSLGALRSHIGVTSSDAIARLSGAWNKESGGERRSNSGAGNSATRRVGSTTEMRSTLEAPPRTGVREGAVAVGGDTGGGTSVREMSAQMNQVGGIGHYVGVVLYLFMCCTVQ